MSKKDSLEYKPVSCWEAYKSKKDRAAMEKTAKTYIEFLSTCKTERESISFLKAGAEKAGFVEGIGAGSALIVNRGKTMLLARKGRLPMSEGVRLIGAHVDTPRIDLKQHPLYEDMDIALAKTHYYGGIRKYQWLARELALHGVVVKKDGTIVEITVGEDPADPVLTITDLLPHLAYKEVVKKVQDAFDAEKLNVVMGHEPDLGLKDNKKQVKENLLKLLLDRYDIREEDLYSSELQIVPAGRARYVGLDEALIGSYGQDDRCCTWCAYEAFLNEPEPEHCQLALFWDKEEIGSDGSTGAKSLFFEYCLDDLRDVWEPTTKLSRILMASQAISADVHAGVDPDFQDVYEKLNASRMGFGPTFSKFTGHRGKVGANDAHPEFIAQLRTLLDDAKVPWQMAELGKVDIGGGGTVAKFLAVYGMDIIDMGPPVLSMHSPFELTSKADVYGTVQAFRTFLKS